MAGIEKSNGFFHRRSQHGAAGAGHGSGEDLSRRGATEQHL